MNIEEYIDEQYCDDCESETLHEVTINYEYDTIEFECTICKSNYIRSK